VRVDDLLWSVQSEAAAADVKYQLTLYKDADYKLELTSFPLHMDVNQRLYVRISAGLLSSFHSFLCSRLIRDSWII